MRRQTPKNTTTTMKKIVALAAIAASTMAFAELKIGIVDMMILVRNQSQYEANKQLLLSTEKDYQKRLDAMKSEMDSMQDEGKKLADEYRNPMLSQAAKTKLENEMMALQQKLMTQQQKLRAEAMRNQQDLGDLEARLLKAQADDIRKRVSDYAGKNGYDCILESTAAIFAKPELDVTDGVLQEMGVDPKTAKRSAEDEGK